MALAVRLGDLLEERSILSPLVGCSAESVLSELAAFACARGWRPDPRLLAQALQEREALGTTAIGVGVAIPHARVEMSEPLRLAVGVAPLGIEFGAADGEPTQLFFLLLSSPSSPSLHIQALAQLSRIARAPQLAKLLVEAPTPLEFLRRIRDAEQCA